MVVIYGRVLRHSTLITSIQSLRCSRPALGYYRGISSSCRLFEAATTVPHSPDALRTRNIGIIAHIDAGKTTTTERMLYYSGHTRRIGDVDEGSTVTDFLPAERARGITIQSAAITFEWPPAVAATVSASAAVTADTKPTSHNINLIDTPGHADFTFEVRRSLRILDGAVCILDGVAGVEAQTEQVWAQAGEWNIPRIAYINKLDRDGAAFGRTVREIGSRLSGWPAVCQIPWFEGGKGRFTGIGDVINLEGLLYEPGGDGKTYQRLPLSQLDQKYPELAKELRRARVALVELLSEHDDELVEAFFEAEEDHLNVTPDQLLQALRRSLLASNSRIIPVFAGASFRNIGVQPLLDAISNLLPSPVERPDPEISLGSSSGGLSQLIAGGLAMPNDNTGKAKKKAPATTPLAIGNTLQGCALAFKVVNDPRKGVLVYIRVYSGSIERNALLYNTNLQNSERATTLLRMYASESVPVQTLNAGEIGVIAGSKFARTGDTLISYAGNKATPPEPLNKLQLRPIRIPPPVFFAAIEPNSLREEKDMHEKLALLLREDPSLQISQDEDTGQTQISGMGELHLEIAQDRLVNEMKAGARMGKIAIGYRETLPEASKPTTKTLDGERVATKGKAGCTAIVEPLQDTDDELEAVPEDVFSYEQDGNIILVETPTLDKRGRPLDADNVALPPNLNLPEIQQAYVNGALAALSRGPSYSYPMMNTKVTLTLRPEEHIFGSDTTYASLTSAARLATIAAFKDATKSNHCSLMEPVMNVDINVDEASLGTVIQDISSSRGGQIVSLGDHEDEVAEGGTGLPRIDVTKIYAPKDPFESGASVSGEQHDRVSFQRTIKAKVPLKEMVGYLKHLRSMTGGRGTFVMSVDRFERVTGPRERALIAELRGGVA